MYPGFDRNFFNELRNITYEQALLAKSLSVTNPTSAPRVYQLMNNDLVSMDFFDTTRQIHFFLGRNRSGRGQIYRFDPDFKVDHRHIYNFTANRSFKGQFNIGFSAGENYNDDHARIGVGFRLNDQIDSEGAEDYWNRFKTAIRQNLEVFNLLLQQYNYIEPVNLLPNIDQILNDEPDYNNDWRFFGVRLVCNNSSDREILHNFNRFMSLSLRVFDDFDNFLQPILRII